MSFREAAATPRLVRRSGGSVARALALTFELDRIGTIEILVKIIGPTEGEACLELGVLGGSYPWFRSEVSGYASMPGLAGQGAKNGRLRVILAAAGLGLAHILSLSFHFFLNRGTSSAETRCPEDGALEAAIAEV